MEYKTIILNSEKEFREYVTSNYKEVYQIIVFEDSLDRVIYFYCFNENNLIVATKKLKYKKFLTYKRYYNRLAKKINFKISNYENQPNVINLVRRNDEKRHN